LNLINRRWEKNKESFNTLSNANRAYWARLLVQNESSLFKTYYFQAENKFTYHIEYFLAKDKRVVEHIEDGVISKNHKRVFNTNHMIFPLTLAPKEKIYVYFKIKNYNKIDIDFFLRNKEYLLDFYQTYNIFEGLFFGGMLLMMLYNLFLYFLLKFRPYIYYVSYTFWLIIYFFGFFGFSERYFPNYTYLFYLSSGAFFVSMTLFIQSILNLKEKLTSINSILNIFIVYFIFGTVANIVVLEMKLFGFAQILFNLFFILIPVFVSIIIFSTYYLAYFKKDSIAKIYSWVWTIVSSVGFLLPLVYLNIINVTIPSDYIFQFLILFEVLCFSFILAYKIKFIQKEKKNQENLLVHQNKLASMGEMISTIAHQWRQPLSEINGIVLEIDMNKRKDKLDTLQLTKHLNEIEEVTAYLSKTIHDFMNLFNHDKELEAFYISDVIKSSKRLALMSAGSDISFSCSIDDDKKIFGYQSELVQSLLIVINNAVDACKSIQKYSEIIIKVESVASEMILITVEDNGGGVSGEVLPNVFNPYFTTKHESQGTGLGLYILKMIIEQSMYGSVGISNGERGVVCSIEIPINLRDKREIDA